MTPGSELVVRFDVDGVSPFEASLSAQNGLNVIHVGVVPTKPLVYVVPHSHYDPEWVENFERYHTVEMPNVIQRLELLHNEPGHCFSLCEETVLKPLAERRPDILADMRGVAEGVRTVQAVRDLAQHIGVEMPISDEVHALLWEGRTAAEAVQNLMLREPKPEVWS